MGACTNTNKLNTQIKESEEINVSAKLQKRSHSLQETQQTVSEVRMLKQSLKKGRSTLLYNPQTPLPVISELTLEQFQSRIDRSISSKFICSGLIQKEQSQVADESKDSKILRFAKSGYKSKNSYI